MSTYTTTADAARYLGVSQSSVRAMIRNGHLRCVGTVGRTVLIDQGSLRRAKPTAALKGRPWGPATAWAALGVLSGMTLNNSEVARRARGHLAGATLASIKARTSSRSVVRTFQGSPTAVRLVGEALTVTGASAMVNPGFAERFGLTDWGDTVHAYVNPDKVDQIVTSLGLVECPDGNITLRVTDQLIHHYSVVPLATAAVDLLDSPKHREREAAERVLNELLTEFQLQQR